MLKIHYGKILATGVFAEGLITSIYVSDLLREHRKDKSFSTIVAESSIQAMVACPFYTQAAKLWHNDKLVVELGKKLRNGEKLYRAIYEICDKYENDKVTVEDALKQLDGLLEKNGKLSVGDRSRIVSLINSSPLMTAVKENEELFYALVIGDNFEEFPTGEEIDKAYLNLIAFAEATATLFHFTRDKKARRSTRKIVKEHLIDIISMKYDNLAGLEDLLVQLINLGDSVFGSPEITDEDESDEQGAPDAEETGSNAGEEVPPAVEGAEEIHEEAPPAEEPAAAEDGAN